MLCVSEEDTLCEQMVFYVSKRPRVNKRNSVWARKVLCKQMELCVSKMSTNGALCEQRRYHVWTNGALCEQKRLVWTNGALCEQEKICVKKWSSVWAREVQMELCVSKKVLCEQMELCVSTTSSMWARWALCEQKNFCMSKTSSLLKKLYVGKTMLYVSWRDDLCEWGDALCELKRCFV